MAAAASAWTASGFRVLGVAVKGEAARLLGEAAGIESNTLAWYLAHKDLDRHPFDARTIVIVDEATTVSDRDLDRLIAVAEATGAVLRLVGDPAQHGSVGAGGTFAALTRLDPDTTPVLDGNRRLKNDVERDTAALIRRGDIGGALDQMRTTGSLIEASSQDEAVVHVLDRWWQARKAGEHHPMVDRLNHTRRTLNQYAHRLLVAAGEVHPTGLTTADGRELCVGDEVIAKAPARHLHPVGRRRDYIRNGSTGKVVAVHPDGLTVDFDALGPIQVPASFIDGRKGEAGLDYSYAVTSYAVQGATFDRSTSVITPASSKAELYVDVTRGREENVVIAVRPDAIGDDSGDLPTLPDDDLLDEIEHGVAKRAGEQCVFEADPLALPAARLRNQLTLAQLSLERSRADDTDPSAGDVLARAERLAEDDARRTAGHDVSKETKRVIGGRPTVPHRAHQWDQAIEAIAVYETRWSTSWLDRPLADQRREHQEVADLVRPFRPEKDDITTLAIQRAIATNARPSPGLSL